MVNFDHETELLTNFKPNGMKKQKMKIYLKFGILIFGILLLLTNCEEDNSFNENISLQKDNSLIFEKLLETAKVKKEVFNIKASIENPNARGIDASFEAKYGTPTFDKTINFTNDEGKPILVIPLKDTNDEVINLLIGYQFDNIEKFRVINKSLGEGNIIYVNSNSSESSRCTETRLSGKLIGGVFKSAKDLLENNTNTSSKMALDISGLPDGCYEWDGNTDCWCFVEVDCDSIGGGGGGSGSGSGSSGGGTGGSGSGSGGGGYGGGSGSGTGGGGYGGGSGGGGSSGGGNGSGTGNTGGTGTSNNPCGEVPFSDDDCDTSKEDLKKVFPNMSDADAELLASIINDKGKDFGIDSDEDLWHFLAQAGHETGGFNTLNVTESTYWTTASKLANTYKKFTMDSTLAATNSNKYYAPDYLQNSSGVANVAMCCRYGNGNVASGDGYKYRGRGLFQLTWKDNYTAFKTWYNNKYDPDIDPVTTPSIISSNDTLAVLSGLWYYKTKVVDKITIDSTTTVSKVTKPINPAKKGLTDRKQRFQKAKDSINCL